MAGGTVFNGTIIHLSGKYSSFNPFRSINLCFSSLIKRYYGNDQLFNEPSKPFDD